MLWAAVWSGFFALTTRAVTSTMARRVNPAIQVLQLSATTGEGLDAWLDWLLALQPDDLPGGVAATAPMHGPGCGHHHG